MNCPVCGTRTKVVKTVDVGERILRKRKCDCCGYKFLTEEGDCTNDAVARKEFNAAELAMCHASICRRQGVV